VYFLGKLTGYSLKKEKHKYLSHNDKVFWPKLDPDGHARTHAVTRWPLTSNAQVQSQARFCDTGSVCHRVLWSAPFEIISPILHIPSIRSFINSRSHSFIHSFIHSDIHFIIADAL